MVHAALAAAMMNEDMGACTPKSGSGRDGYIHLNS